MINHAAQSLRTRWPPGSYTNVQRCGELSMVPLQLKDKLELVVKRREFLPGSGFLSHRDMT